MADEYNMSQLEDMHEKRHKEDGHKKKRKRSKDRERKRSHSKDQKSSEKRSSSSKHTEEYYKAKDEEKRRRVEIERGRNVDKLEDYHPHRQERDQWRDGSDISYEGGREIHTKKIREERKFRTIEGESTRDSAEPELTTEERDARTIFCMQLAARIRPRDLEDFFSSVGKVRDVRLILDNKSHRSKGIAYIEFKDVSSVNLAIGLSGQRLLGVPIIVQYAHAERNRMPPNNHIPANKPYVPGPGKLYVGSLHFNITEDMLRGIFEPFGKLLDLKLVKDHVTGKSAGYAFLTFQTLEDSKRAMEQLNSFEIAGRAIKITAVVDKPEGTVGFDADEMERAGFNLGATGRAQLMARLAEGTGMELPPAVANVLNKPAQSSYTGLFNNPPISTQCFMLSNMFDPNKQSGSKWVDELKDEVIEECNKHGGVLHLYVDQLSPDGNVYVKCSSIAAANATVNALHGRYFDGKVITAAYVPLPNYSALFSDSIRSTQLLKPPNP